MKGALLGVFLGALAVACGRPAGSSGSPAPSASASQHPEQRLEQHEDEPGHAALPRRVRLSPAVVAEARIRTEPVVSARLAPTLALPGEVATDPDKTARVSALVGGRLESISFREGQAVKRGDALAVLRVPELGKAKAAFAATQAKAGAARTNAERLKALLAQRLASDQEVVAASAEAAALEAETRAAEEQLRALGTGASGSVAGSQLTLRAPVSGVVIARDAVVGQPVAPEQTLATIADLGEVWFLARVFEKNLGQIRLNAPVDVQLNAYPREHFSGTVEYLGRQIDPAARTVTARVRLTNRADLLRIGLFGVAHVGTGEGDAGPLRLVVDQDAVTDLGGKPVVFVRQEDGDYDVHDVVLGDAALGKVQIVNGLREGEPVVVEGVFTLKSTVLRSTFAEEE